MPSYFWDTETVNVSRAGTGWTVDVTAAQLDADLSIKDFRVLFAGVVQNIDNFTKTTAQLITYTGSSYTGAVEVRRLTPTAVRSLVEYQERFSSLDYNRNFERVARQVGEFRALGVGGGTVLVNDGAYGPLWSGDVSAAPSRASVYTQLEAMQTAQAIVDAAQTSAINLRAPLVSPTLTGIPLAPTASSADNSTQIATTAHVKSLGYETAANVALKANIASPTLTGTPAAPTAGVSTNTTQIATTGFVQGVVGSRSAVRGTSSGSGSTYSLNIPSHLQNADSYTIYVRWNTTTTNDRPGIWMRVNGDYSVNAYQLVGVYHVGTVPPAAIGTLQPLRWGDLLSQSAVSLTRCEANGQNLGSASAVVRITGSMWEVSSTRHIASVRLGDYIHQIGFGPGSGLTNVEVFAYSDQSNALTTLPITLVSVVAHGVL